MKPHELFGMLLKLLGIWLIVGTLRGMPAAVHILQQVLDQIDTVGKFLVIFSEPAVQLICGCFLLFYSDWFVRSFVPINDADAVGMTSRELFEVFARTIGVWQLTVGIVQLPRAVQSLEPYSDDHEFVRIILNSFAAPGICIIVGLFLLLGTGWLVRVSYHDPAATDQDAQSLTEDDEHRQNEDGEDKP